MTQTASGLVFRVQMAPQEGIVLNFEKLKSRKVEKCKGIVLNFEKSKSRKVEKCKGIVLNFEKSKS